MSYEAAPTIMDATGEGLAALSDLELYNRWQVLVSGPRERDFERAAGNVVVEMVKRFGLAARSSSFTPSKN